MKIEVELTFGYRNRAFIKKTVQQRGTRVKRGVTQS
jgi:hypothetical protein